MSTASSWSSLVTTVCPSCPTIAPRQRRSPIPQAAALPHDLHSTIVSAASAGMEGTVCLHANQRHPTAARRNQAGRDFKTQEFDAHEQLEASIRTNGGAPRRGATLARTRTGRLKAYGVEPFNVTAKLSPQCAAPLRT